MNSAIRLSIFCSLLVSIGSFAYFYAAPEGFHPIILFGSPVLILALGFLAKLLSSRQRHMDSSGSEI